MKASFAGPLLVSLLFSPAIATAQSAAVVPAPASEPAAPSVEATHDELRALKATMEKALNAGDVDALVAHVTDDVVFTTMNGDVVRGPDGIRKYFAKMMQGKDRVVDRITTRFEPDALSILLKDDVAISYGRSEDHYELASGQRFDVEARWSTTMVRREGRWLVASFHYSTNMFDNPVLTAQRRLLIGIAAVIGLLLAVAGFLAGRRAGRKKSMA